MTSKKIIWNEEAVAQEADELEPGEVKCVECGTTPRRREFGRLSCECGKVEGALAD